ncbi:hypothetical protein A0259_13840 [Shigella sp. PAMC 28760]|nr:hypothetical protein ECD_01906 [Escherichia coli BL21(DE3)]AKN48003.1 hypothetical protein TZ57_10040 [Escherichia coli]AMH22769.1 hypothetical protein C2566_13570 [Escherichia coli B]AMH27082.1 hypothetical protein C3029_14175 [Escherichia coli B]AMR23632.1 hypothetical protein A0259_13840 [Shigella sp. PAMC 28760]
MRILNCYMANDSKGHFVTAKEAAKHNRQDVLCCVSCGCPLTLQRGNDGYGRCFADRQNLMVCLRSMPNVFTGSCARMRCCLSENLLYRHRNGHIQAEWP